MFEKLKARRKEKRSIKDPYTVQELKLCTMLQELEPGTDKFKEIQNELKLTNQMRGESRESKRRISKQDKGGIIIKVLGIFGAGAGLASIIWAEKSGLTFTGEKRSIMDAIAKGIGNVFVRR